MRSSISIKDPLYRKCCLGILREVQSPKVERISLQKEEENESLLGHVKMLGESTFMYARKRPWPKTKTIA